MFNFLNIDPREFEEIGKDLIEKIKGQSFRSFSSGRDGGIDLLNEDGSIMGQSKFYLGSQQANVINAMKKEIHKVKAKNPKEYYVFIGREMSEENIEIIYQLFKDYMISSKNNIYTLKEIDKLLEIYLDIVDKHIKLWLHSSQILSKIWNQNIFIDCENLLSDIEQEKDIFVQTQNYIKCKKLLEENKMLVLLGEPGVGKTTISKMLILYYAKEGYQIRYSESNNIGELKKSLAQDQNKKEVILIDDCLGQRYMDLHAGKDKELISIIKYVERNENKLLIMNSRITVFNEAKRKGIEFEKYINTNKIKIEIIKMEDLSNMEKAQLLYAHLYYRELPEQYRKEIMKTENYWRIIKHRNFNPRILEYITEKNRYDKIEAQSYFPYMMNILNHPDTIWKEEYEERLDIVDRILLLVLYSITDYSVEEDILEKAFYERLKLEQIDTTTNIYHNTLQRLTDSMLKIIENKGKRYISVVNPSVNDFLKTTFIQNERDKIKKSMICFSQMARCCKTQEEYDMLAKQYIIDKKFLNLKTNRLEKNINNILLAHLICYGMQKEMPSINMKESFTQIEEGYTIKEKYVTKEEIICNILEKPLCEICKTENYFYDGNYIVKLLNNFSWLNQQIEVLNAIYDENKQKLEIKNEQTIITFLQNEFNHYTGYYDIPSLEEEYDLDGQVGIIIEELKMEYEEDYKWSRKNANEMFKNELIRRVKRAFKEMAVRKIEEQIIDLCCDLPTGLFEEITTPNVEKSIKSTDIKILAEKYIDLVYDTPDEDYTYYRKYLFQGITKKNEKEQDEQEKINNLFHIIN